MVSPLLVIIGIIVAVILIDAARNRILFRIGLRNLKRRKVNTLIVILGLMIGTAIISSSLGIGDTMDNFIEGNILDDMDRTDITVYNTTQTRDYLPVSESVYRDFKSDIITMNNVDGVTGEVIGSVPIQNPSSLLSEPSVSLMGVNTTDSQAFGSFYSDGERVEFDLDDDEIYIDTELSSDIEAESGDTVQIVSAAFAPTGRNYKNYTVKAVLDDTGRAAWGGGSKIIVTVEQAQQIRGLPNRINFIKVSCTGGVQEGGEYSEEVSEKIDELVEENPQYQPLEVQETKNNNLETFKQQISTLTDLFLILGSFAIIAGVILTINIFVMLGEERKSESGMSRAIGMKRRHLIRVFTYEGLIYSVSASFVGVLAGVGISYVVFYFIGGIFGTQGGPSTILDYFTYQSSSFYAALTAGFLITMGTIVFTVFRISKLNIIRAIREIPEPPIHKKSRRILILAVVALIAGGILTFIGFQSEQLWMPTTGVSLLIIGGGAVVRRWVGDKIAYNIVGIFLMIWWLAPLPFFEAYIADIEMFIISGLFVVTAGVMLVVVNDDLILKGMEGMVGSARDFKAVILSAISHPLKEKFRTGMALFIFALIIFSIVVMSMITGIFHSNIDRIIEEESGGYEIIGFTSTGLAIDNIHGEIRRSQELDIDDFDEIDYALRGFAPAPGGGSYQLMGVNSNFGENNSYGFSGYIDSIESENQVWDTVLSNSSLIIAPSTLSQFQVGGVSYELGDEITLIDKNGVPTEKKIAAKINQTAINGFYLSEETVRQEFNITDKNMFFLNLDEGVDADELGKDMEKELYEFGFQPIILGTVIRESLSAQFMFFDLFSGYMGLGLIVGIAGLGIISLRAVHERRLEIGMMRAIGFKRKMIGYAFIIENSFITITGIIMGVIFGIITGYNLYVDGFEPMGWEFHIPWLRIVTICVIAYVVMLLTAIPSAHRASKVSPAEALRFD